MSVGKGLLHTFANSNVELSVLESNNINASSFIKDEKTIYEFIVSHISLYGRKPSIQTIEVETGVTFPRFPDEPIEYWIREVHERNDGACFLDVSRAIQDSVKEGDIEAARRVFFEAYERVQRGGGVSILSNLKDVAPDVVSMHDQRQRSGQLSGITFGFDYLDKVSDGAQPGDTIAIVGRPSVGKSYILFKMATQAYSLGHVPLVVSMEMPKIQCARRLLSLLSGVPVRHVRFGKLSHWGREKLLRGISNLSDDRAFPLMPGSLELTIDRIESIIREVSPSAVYLDGGYLVRTRKAITSRWERITEVAEIVKKCATKYDIPIFVSYQFNRQGPGSLGNIGGADAVGQLASIVLSVDDDKEMTAAAQVGIEYKTVQLVKGREGEKGKILIVFNMMKTGVDQHSIIEDYSGVDL